MNIFNGCLIPSTFGFLCDCYSSVNTLKEGQGNQMVFGFALKHCRKGKCMWWINKARMTSSRSLLKLGDRSMGVDNTFVFA